MIIHHIRNSNNLFFFRSYFITGEIIIADSLVREPMRNEYSIVVKAVDNGAPGLSNSTNVTILVPVNHPPSVQNSFHFYIMENSALRQFVGKITAEDRDLGRVKGEKLTFTLVDKAGKIFCCLI